MSTVLHLNHQTTQPLLDQLWLRVYNDPPRTNSERLVLITDIEELFQNTIFPKCENMAKEIAEKDEEIAEKDEEIARKADAIAAADEAIAAADEAIAENEKEIAEFNRINAEIAEAELCGGHFVDDLNEEIAELKAEKEKEIAEKDEELRDLKEFSSNNNEISELKKSLWCCAQEGCDLDFENQKLKAENEKHKENWESAGYTVNLLDDKDEEIAELKAELAGLPIAVAVPENPEENNQEIEELKKDKLELIKIGLDMTTKNNEYLQILYLNGYHECLTCHYMHSCEPSMGDGYGDEDKCVECYKKENPDDY